MKKLNEMCGSLLALKLQHNFGKPRPIPEIMRLSHGDNTMEDARSQDHVQLYHDHGYQKQTRPSKD
ncbi:Protein of unknown function [Gryllus bimaculatus]|nr:Protein of unknown function [Gryllus bimaculatus]